MTLLEATRQALGPAPRKLSGRLSALFDPWPSWLVPTDEQARIKTVWRELLDQGDVVWGHVVSANQLLWAPGSITSVASVVHVAAGDRSVHIEELERAANRIPHVRADSVDEGLATLGASVAKEVGREFSLPVPPLVGDGRPLLFSTVLIAPHHLPLPYLAAGFLPLMASAKHREVILLPSRAWSADLVEAWTAFAAEP
jgi:hypothetical protein